MSTIDELQAELNAEREAHAQTKSALTHWMKNHDAQIERARFLIERRDLPIERVRAYRAMGEYHGALQRAASAAGLLAGDDVTTKLVPRIWLFRELLWNANQWSIYHNERLPFGELVAEHGALSTDSNHE